MCFLFFTPVCCFFFTCTVHLPLSLTVSLATVSGARVLLQWILLHRWRWSRQRSKLVVGFNRSWAAAVILVPVRETLCCKACYLHTACIFLYYASDFPLVFVLFASVDIHIVFDSVCVYSPSLLLYWPPDILDPSRLFLGPQTLGVWLPVVKGTNHHVGWVTVNKMHNQREWFILYGPYLCSNVSLKQGNIPAGEEIMTLESTQLL